MSRQLDAPAPFVRTAQTWIRYGQLGLVAFLIDGYAPTVRLVAGEIDVPMSIAALHGTAFGVGFIFASLLSARLTRRLGRTRAIGLGSIGVCAGTLMYIASPWLVGTLAGMGIAGFFGTLIQSNAYADLADRHQHVRARVLNEAAALSQLAGVLAPFLIGLASVTLWGWRAGLAVVVLLSTTLAVVETWARRGTAGAGEPPAGTPVPITGRLPRGFWTVWAAMAAVLGIEFATAMWAPVWLAAHTDIAPALATASPTFMLLGLFVGRLAVSRLAARFSVDALLLCSVAMSVAGFAVFWSSPSWIVALAGLFVTGLGIAGQFPLSLARLIAVSDDRPDEASAFGTLALGIAIAGGPLVLGAVESAAGVALGLAVVPVFAAVTIVLVLARRTCV